jgi:hypothetical protein
MGVRDLYIIVGTLLPFALGIAISPAPIIAAILLLTSNRSPAKGLAYLAGWLAGLVTLLFAILLLVTSRDYSRWKIAAQFTGWAILIAGIILLIMAYVQWRQRPPLDAELMPLEWLQAMPQATSLMALGAGLFFGLFSLKNLLIVAATAAIIGETGLGLGGRILAILIFATIATIGIATPAYVSLTQGERARETLVDWEYRLSIHNVTITCIVLVTIAVQLLGSGLSRLL